MRLGTRQAAIVLWSVALIGMTDAALARPIHKQAETAQDVAEADDRYAFMRADWERTHGTQKQTGKHKRERAGKHGRAETKRARRIRARAEASSAVAAQPIFGGGGLVAEARRYLGTNPTGRRSLWCGAFMDMVLKRTGHKGGGNLALAYSRYGTRVSGPRVGALAVMRRGGGGHVGVVSGIDSNGNPIIVSGNHNNTVAESVYPRGRIIAYVMPGG